MGRYVPSATVIGIGKEVIINFIYLKISWLITNRIIHIRKQTSKLKNISWVGRVESFFWLINA